MPPRTPKKVTLFSWGYEGWGNATRRLVAVTDEAERSHGFRPPMFVDIRYNRSVRAVGFRDKAFEEMLGHSRYRWMRSLGNANIGSRRRGIQINCPDAADQLLDLAIDAAADRRRVIFFCSCPSPEAAAGCHRATVAKLLVRVGRRRSIGVEVVEWPGGTPAFPRIKLKVSEETLRAVVAGRKVVPLGRTGMPKNLISIPWGSMVELRSPKDTQVVSAGPANFEAGRWRLPIFLFPVEPGDTPILLRPFAMKLRRELALDPRQS